MYDIFAALSAPFDPADVSWRCGPVTGDKKKGMALAFADARVFMERLDDVLTPAGWQNKYSHANGKTVCDLGILYGDTWIWKADGAGDTDNEAEKGALSDAFKRACVRHGIGRYLYSLKSPWVEIEETWAGSKKYKIKDSEFEKLNALLENHAATARLIIEAGTKSNEGIETYKSYYLALSLEQRNLLAPYHEQFKRNAQKVSNNPSSQKAA